MKQEEARSYEQEEAEGLCGGGGGGWLYPPTPHKGLPATYHPGARPGVQRERYMYGCCVVVVFADRQTHTHIYCRQTLLLVCWWLVFTCGGALA
jgi:hypothetical protein